MKTLKELVMKYDKIYLVTHNEMCHTDDVLATALLRDYLHLNGVDTEIIRTRDKSQVPEGENVIVYDVFGGVLDHHQDKPVKGSRNLAAIGKIWRWGKEEFKNTYGLDETAWWEIDKDIISWVDKTDTTGEMNPLNKMINGIRCKEEDDFDTAFYSCLNVMTILFQGTIYEAHKNSIGRELYKSFPILDIDGLTFRYNSDSNNYVKPNKFDGSSNGYIWKRKDNTYGVNIFSGPKVIIPGIREGEREGVVFTHQGGFMAYIEGLEYLSSILKDR